MMSRRWRGQRTEHCHRPALLYCLCLPWAPTLRPDCRSLPWAPTLRPAVPACLGCKVPLGKSTASFACHPESSKGADSRQATRQLVREGSLGQG